MNQLVFLPVLLPLVTAVVLLLVRGRLPLQRLIAALSTALTYGLSIYLLTVVSEQGIQIYKQGNWPPPFGITLVADLTSSIMVILSQTIATAALLYSFQSLDRERESFYFYPLFFFLNMGVNGAFLTGDIFNLFVFFEVMLISSYALMSLGGRVEQLEATVKYIGINLLSSTLLLTAIGLLYGLVGTLNMADLSQKISQSADKGAITAVAMVFLVVFGIKAALFPLYYWMPGAYTPMPAGTAAYFAGILTKVGVYAILRVFTLLFNYDPGYIHTIILVIAGATMFMGVLGAVAQRDFRTILTYHIISQIGYMIMGIGIFTPFAIAGTIFYIVHHIIVKSCLFLVGGLAERLTGVQDIKQMGGIANSRPFAGFLFMVVGLSLAGFPPLSGFFAKLMLVQAGIEAGGYLNIIVVAISLVVSLLTLFSMMKIWHFAFWGEPVKLLKVPYGVMTLSIVFLVSLTIIMGLYSGPFVDLSLRAAEQLMNPQVYIEAVLGGG